MSEQRTLGVIGALVWDRFLRTGPKGDPVEEWGGISYAISALSASLPSSWKILPILKLGQDLSEGAVTLLNEIPRVDQSCLMIVPEDNNRVELSYSRDGSRTERLTGGVPGWSWDELAPLVDICDALYINFISGFEMELETAEALRDDFSGPIYADLHSLFLSTARGGARVPTPLNAWKNWFQCFDVVQMNEAESKLVGCEGDLSDITFDPLRVKPRLIAITLGDRGAQFFTTAGFECHCDNLVGLPTATVASSGRVPVLCPPCKGDPTGCGDVWGATAFARLLAGDALEDAISKANELASQNVGQLGARNLFNHLEGKLSHFEETR
ncbi:MAG: carbohydrate kinase family protein [Gemmatimonadetes bacterium]|nr:carbohydrate kinase family protein [Gemmatimonadota bacterium]HIA99036.1 carbohydrate kinase family protein [Gemmatimonadota bacterium]